VSHAGCKLSEMNLLVITWNYPPRRGGIENLIANLCVGLRKKHLVLVVTSHAPAVNSVERDIYRAPLPGLVFFALYALWRGAFLLVRNPGVRVVFGGSALTTPLVLMLARMFGRRAIIQTHGLDIIYYRNFIYQQVCVRWLKFCDGVVANSSYTAALAESKGVARDRLSVIPPGVQPERFNVPTDVVATKRHWNLDGRKIILFVGRLARRKGVKEFIENSLVRIVQEIPEACFLIVGDNPTDSLAHREDIVSGIKATIGKSSLEQYVRLIRSLGDDEVIKLYQACDVVVLPALNVDDDVEGFGIVAVEAAAAGKPVVATRVGGIPDAIEDGKSGILVDPGDYTDLSQAVIALLKSSEASSSMGNYGRCRVTRQLDWDNVIRRYETVLHQSDTAPF
jgi:phosphatidyl-myo-inositol dimannoside synthase